MRRRAGIPLATIGSALVATAAFFHRAVFTRDVFLERDILRVVLPLKAFWAERIAAGDWPEWFPYDGLGQPFVGMVISASFHPTNLLFLVFPLADAQKLCTLVCYPFGCLGMFVWLRSFSLSRSAAAVGAFGFVFNGYMVGLTNNVLYLMAAATLPWVFWAGDRFLRRPSLLRAATAASLLAGVLFAGDSQSFGIACTLTLLVPLSRPDFRARLARNFGLMAATVGLGFLLAAPVLLPAAELLSEITAGDRPIEVALTWSVHPLQALELVVGSLFAGDADSSVTASIDQDLLKLGKTAPWVESLHLGLPILLLAFIALLVHRRQPAAKLLAALTLMLLLLALGKHAGLYTLVFEWVPLWRPFRYPVKLIAPLFLVLCAGAAFGFELVTTRVAFRRPAAFAFLGFGIFFLILFALEGQTQLLSRAAISSLWTRVPQADALDRLGAAFEVAAIQTCVVCVLIGLALLGIRRLDWANTLVVVAIGVHLFVVNEPHFQVSRPELLKVLPPFVEKIRSEGKPAFGHFRMVDVPGPQHLPQDEALTWNERMTLAGIHSLAADIQHLWGLESSNNILPGTSARYATLCKQKDLWLWRYAGLFNTRYVSIPSEVYGALGGDPREVLAVDAPYRLALLEKRDVRPRAYLARATCVADGPSALRALGSPEGLAADEAVVECGNASPALAANGPLGDVTITAYEPERVSLVATAISPAVLVLNDAAFEGWTAHVDGATVPILRANYAVRGIRLSPGSHTVVFEYRTPGLRLGLMVSLLSLVAVLAVGLVLQRRATSAA